MASTGAITSFSRFIIGFGKVMQKINHQAVFITIPPMLLGYAYGDFKGGFSKDRETQKTMKILDEAYERHHQSYISRKTKFEAEVEQMRLWDHAANDGPVLTFIEALPDC